MSRRRTKTNTENETQSAESADPTENETQSESGSLLGLEADGDDEAIESGSAAVAGLNEEGDDFVVPETHLAPEPQEDGLTDADRAEYRKAYATARKDAQVQLPKSVEKTPSGKTIYVLENLSCKVGNRRTVVKAGTPLPKGILAKARIALLLDQKKLSASPPKRKGEKRTSLLGLT